MMETHRKILSKYMRICARTEKCTSEIVEKMTHEGIEKTIQKKIIQELVAGNFIDDSRYAMAFCREKNRLNAWGKIKLSHVLKHKQINRELIEKALGSLDETEYISILRKQLEKKLKICNDQDYNMLYGKLYRFGLSKGFESPLVQQLVDELIKEKKYKSLTYDI